MHIIYLAAISSMRNVVARWSLNSRTADHRAIARPSSPPRTVTHPGSSDGDSANRRGMTTEASRLTCRRGDERTAAHDRSRSRPGYVKRAAAYARNSARATVRAVPATAVPSRTPSVTAAADSSSSSRRTPDRPAPSNRKVASSHPASGHRHGEHSTEGDQRVAGGRAGDDRQYGDVEPITFSVGWPANGFTTGGIRTAWQPLPPAPRRSNARGAS
jgi:hypothetical protein